MISCPSSVLDHVDEKRVFEFVQKSDLELVSLFFCDTREVNFEGIQVIIFTSKIDIGLASLSEFEMQSVAVNVAQDGIVVLRLHRMYYKRIPTF